MKPITTTCLLLGAIKIGRILLEKSLALKNLEIYKN